VADILFGDVNPSGRLPFTYPRYPNALVTYDHKYTQRLSDNVFNPQFEFGYGIGYTTFEYSGLKLSRDTITATQDLQVTVNVKNTGRVAGKEVVQLYVSDLYRSITPPVRELKRFRKIDLRPGESKPVSFTLKTADLAFVGLNNQWVTEPGKFRVSAGGLSAEFTLR